jgi:hypothetical protein
LFPSRQGAAALAAGLLLWAAETGLCEDFRLPVLDEGKIAAAGIRKLAGRHIALYTDLPAAAEIDELPRVFDAAVPQWCAYFGVDPATLTTWKIVGCVIQEKARFQGAGLYPENLPEFPHGYSRGSQLWLYEQPSGYYCRHLLLHEGTHCFMQRWLGGAGPPWYMEGIAELLATHAWQDGALTLKVMPRSKQEVPYWGRVKIVKDELAAGRGMSLLDILRYDNRAHVRTEPYAWCWAAAAFFDEHPLTQKAFRELKSDTRDWTTEFSRKFYNRLKDRWPEIGEDWQLFIAEIDYGYDFARAAIVRQPTKSVPPAGASVRLAADRGWQSSGLRLEAGREYRITASGRYQLTGGSEPWPCEAGGVTIRYHVGQPLGTLMAAVSDLEGEAPTRTPLADPKPVGLTGSVKPERTGTLYLKVNEPASGLADNSGSLTVQVIAVQAKSVR